MPPSKPLRILLLCDRLPDGPVDGLLLRVHHLLAALSGRHRVDLVCWREPGQTLPSDRPRFARTWLLDRPLKTRPGAWWRPLMDWNPDHIYPRSEPLARLLNHERLTSLDAVADASTTRLSAVVFYLASKYGWTIESTDKAAGCRDGRVAWVSEYTLPADTVARAMAAGAAAWCADVRAARRALRAKAAEARRKADRANDARKTRPHPGQWGLFEGVAA